MKGIDTNVLVRIIAKDDELQSKKALNYIKRHQPVFVSTLVLCETCWVLTSCYKVHKTDLINILENILQTEQIVLENSEIAWLAMNDYKQFSGDFADYLIAYVAKHHECDALATFDKSAGKSDIFELIH